MSDDKKISSSVASAISSVIEERKEELKSGFQYRCSNPECGQEYPPNSHGPSVCAMCGNPMHIHRPDPVEQEKKPVEGADDALVGLGDLSEASLNDITFGKNYEAVAMDYVATFNGAVTQGMAPIKALMAMSQAFTIIAGQCIRAGLKPSIVGAMIKSAIERLRSSSREVAIAIESSLKH